MTINLTDRAFKGAVGVNADTLLSTTFENLAGFSHELRRMGLIEEQNIIDTNEAGKSGCYEISMKDSDKKFAFIFGYDNDFLAKKMNLFYVDVNGDEHGVSFNYWGSPALQDFLSSVKHSIENDGQWPDVCPNDVCDNNGGNIRIAASKPSLNGSALYTVGTAPA